MMLKNYPMPPKALLQKSQNKKKQRNLILKNNAHYFTFKKPAAKWAFFIEVHKQRQLLYNLMILMTFKNTGIVHMLKKYFIVSLLFIAHTASLYPSAPQAAKLVKNYTFNVVAFSVSTTMRARAEYTKSTAPQQDFTHFHTTKKNIVNSTKK